MTVWFASGNTHKKGEIRDILSQNMLFHGKDIAWELKIPSEAGIDFSPKETGSTFLENALIKAHELYLLRPGDPIIADDSGICVDALGGRPGIFSARYESPGTIDDKFIQNFTSQGRGDTERYALLLSELGDNPQRSARFICAMVLYCGPDRFFAAQETMEGEIVKNSDAARGKGGFGYDPILYIPELGRTVAELSDEEKNLHSHRGKAGRVIARILEEILT